MSRGIAIRVNQRTAAVLQMSAIAGVVPDCAPTAERKIARRVQLIGVDRARLAGSQRVRGEGEDMRVGRIVLQRPIRQLDGRRPLVLDQHILVGFIRPITVVENVGNLNQELRVDRSRRRGCTARRRCSSWCWAGCGRPGYCWRPCCGGWNCWRPGWCIRRRNGRESGRGCWWGRRLEHGRQIHHRLQSQNPIRIYARSSHNSQPNQCYQKTSNPQPPSHLVPPEMLPCGHSHPLKVRTFVRANPLLTPYDHPERVLRGSRRVVTPARRCIGLDGRLALLFPKTWPGLPDQARSREGKHNTRPVADTKPVGSAKKGF